MRREHGEIALLQMPAARLGLDGEIGGEQTEELPHVRGAARIGETDAMRRVPFQEMGEVARPHLVESRNAGPIEHARPPKTPTCTPADTPRLIVALGEAKV